jgi:hypothetical protein
MSLKLAHVFLVHAVLCVLFDVKSESSIMTTLSTDPELVTETGREAQTSFLSSDEKKKKKTKSTTNYHVDQTCHVGDFNVGSTERRVSSLSCNSTIKANNNDDDDESKPNSHRQNVKAKEVQAQREEGMEYLRDDDDDRVMYPGAFSSSPMHDEAWIDGSDDDDEAVATVPTTRIVTTLDNNQNNNGAGDNFLTVQADRVPSENEQLEIIKNKFIEESPVAQPVPKPKGLNRKVTMWCSLASCFCCTGCLRLFEMCLVGMQQ